MVSTAQLPARAHPRWPGRLGGGWFVLSCVAIAVMAPLPYLTSSLDTLAAADTGLARHYATQPAPLRWALLVHAATAGAALLLTPLQASGALRRRAAALHRGSGRLLLVLLLAAAASGLVIAQVSYAGLSGRLGFSALALLWAGAALRAVGLARRGDLTRHQAWAKRTFALTYAAVTLRLWMVLFVVLQRPETDLAARSAFDRAYPVVPFLCWVPNLLIAEWFIRTRASTADGGDRSLR